MKIFASSLSQIVRLFILTAESIFMLVGIVAVCGGTMIPFAMIASILMWATNEISTSELFLCFVASAVTTVIVITFMEVVDTEEGQAAISRAVHMIFAGFLVWATMSHFGVL
jgi:uncharacterized membrane protein